MPPAGGRACRGEGSGKVTVAGGETRRDIGVSRRYLLRRTQGVNSHRDQGMDCAMAARVSASSPTARSPPRRSTTSGRSTTSRPVVTG